MLGSSSLDGVKQVVPSGSVRLVLPIRFLKAPQSSPCEVHEVPSYTVRFFEF